MRHMGSQRYSFDTGDARREWGREGTECCRDLEVAVPAAAEKAVGWGSKGDTGPFEWDFLDSVSTLPGRWVCGLRESGKLCELQRPNPCPLRNRRPSWGD